MRGATTVTVWPGLLEEPPLQPHRHLSPAEGLEVLIAEHHDVHGAYSGIGSPR